MSERDMSEEVRAYLDGEVELDALSPAAREEAAMWDRATVELRRPAGGAPSWLEDQIMTEIEAGPVEQPTPQAEVRQSWLRRPIDVRVTPLTGLLVAAGMAAILVLPRTEATAPPTPETVYVQFVLEAPSAQSVSVAGDFSGWDETHTLDDPDGDGVWTGRVPLKPGMHQYMFVIDGADWVTDPQAERYADDGFGNRNAVISVGAPAQVVS
jgi:hypothetical protein